MRLLRGHVQRIQSLLFVFFVLRERVPSPLNLRYPAQQPLVLFLSPALDLLLKA
jgi:hypothetical protein